MKKAFEMPKIVVEQFVPNEYVAACGEENKVYKFECDAVGGSWLTDGGWVYIESNGEPGLQITGSNPDTGLGAYSPCGETHEAESTDTFLNGYIVNIFPFGYKEVIIWRGANNDNTHCTTDLNMSEWETLKS